jgi:type VI protein secretion system component VasK
MNKEKLVEIIQGVLKTDVDLAFLLQLRKSELETLIACIRDRVEQVGE